MIAENPNVIPITESVQAAILRYLEEATRTPQSAFYSLPLEALRVDVGRAVLEALDLHDPPRPVVPEVAPRSVRRRPTVPFITRARVMARDGFQCRTCGSEVNLTIDHIVPFSLGGSDEESNLRTLCGPCNSRKGARMDA